ncbi:MAG: hypothetical protein ACFFAZ_11950 [Promethearchaeota archaeon]
MSHKRAIVWAVAGVFIMFSFFELMNLALSSGDILIGLVLTLIAAGIGFYILGYGFDIE